jgi:hypothetical protein
VIYWARHLEKHEHKASPPLRRRASCTCLCQEKKSAGDEHGRARIESPSVFPVVLSSWTEQV